MKSPYQIAKELNVSPQAVYKRITNEFINQFTNHMQRTEKGKYKLDIVAEQGLKDLFNQVVQPIQQQNIEQVEQPLLNQLNSENSFLRSRVESLEEELKTERTHSREQMDKLSDLAAQLTELTRNNQVLLGAEQRRTNSALLIGGESVAHQSEEQQQSKKGFFQRFFKKR